MNQMDISTLLTKIQQLTKDSLKVIESSKEFADCRQSGFFFGKHR